LSPPGALPTFEAGRQHRLNINNIEELHMKQLINKSSLRKLLKNQELKNRLDDFMGLHMEELVEFYLPAVRNVELLHEEDHSALMESAELLALEAAEADKNLIFIDAYPYFIDAVKWFLSKNNINLP
jgi:hypothetical protein